MTTAFSSPAAPPSEAAQRDQRVFRVLLRALSYPGRVVLLPALPSAPAPLCPALAGLLLGLLDLEAGLWLTPALDCPPIRSFLTYRAAVQFVATPREAVLAVVDDPAGLPPLDAFHPGEPACPERSTTVLLRVPALAGGPAVALRGPGIEATATVAPRVPYGFWDQWARNHARYPLGIDIIMTDGVGLVGLPRSVGRE
ncbi:alpha-D-ribose 1-methylphosphonate 5-triphosphate synthase subunit PhnH [Angulomicrobium tetraedrale]|uniref:Alpha-D-ribose 1-methylphosphonate 5-triphosphate synthase subunit PhnH n=1 Tax=Ancylobacter tetraedralis TaxID=217068 RepID=A0A839Z5X5_9HYPH|nr:phosphonate C-P lyase system protein PhnH [Ancylobacter tetraedralis]MBB3769438.1 alpha-D-ribose 1-methylphosphonate 5-triphosphate synthase subunit PhnH [Ancylobacter tetraedralis]